VLGAVVLLGTLIGCSASSDRAPSFSWVWTDRFAELEPEKGEVGNRVCAATYVQTTSARSLDADVNY
jgi:hypothetical protein